MRARRRVVSVVGTRPNYVKIAPIAALLERDEGFDHLLVDTGQHPEQSMSQIFLEQLGIGAPDRVLGVGSGTHGVQIARVIERLEPVLLELEPDVVLVPGDVNSTMAASVVAAKLGHRLGHVEAGLRSFDRTMPEEINRVIADSLADLLFTHSPEARSNLLSEGCPEQCIFSVGNTMIDTLVAMAAQIEQAHTPGALGLDEGEYLLVTLHRAALTDGPGLAAAIRELRTVASTLPVVFPVHPRTRARIESAQLSTEGITVLGPLGYVEFISLASNAAAVLTDSGGVQEETTFLGVPCFTLRDSTERPITLSAGTNVLLGLAPERISSIPELLAGVSARNPEPIPGWDGRAAERLVEVLGRDELPSRAELAWAARPGEAQDGGATPASRAAPS